MASLHELPCLPTKDFEEISSTIDPPVELCQECARLTADENCQASDEIVP